MGRAAVVITLLMLVAGAAGLWDAPTALGQGGGPPPESAIKKTTKGAYEWETTKEPVSKGTIEEGASEKGATDEGAVKGRTPEGAPGGTTEGAVKEPAVKPAEEPPPPLMMSDKEYRARALSIFEGVIRSMQDYKKDVAGKNVDTIYNSLSILIGTLRRRITEFERLIPPADYYSEHHFLSLTLRQALRTFLEARDTLSKIRERIAALDPAKREAARERVSKRLDVYAVKVDDSIKWMWRSIDGLKQGRLREKPLGQGAAVKEPAPEGKAYEGKVE